MAGVRAIAAVCEAVVGVLRANYRVDEFHQDAEFKVYLPNEFQQPMAVGVSLFLYRVCYEGTHRTPPGRISPNGRRYRTDLPLNLNFLLTAWGSDASLQHEIAGWMMRTIEDTPILPSAVLNGVYPGVFRPDETVEIGFGEIDSEDLFDLWESLLPHTYHLSVPYVARNVRIESRRTMGEGDLIQERQFDYHQVEP